MRADRYAIGSLFRQALETLLQSTNLGHVLKSISSLEMFALISPVVCRRMVDEGAVPVLFKLLTTCNRSAPHQKIVGHVGQKGCEPPAFRPGTGEPVETSDAATEG